MADNYLSVQLVPDVERSLAVPASASFSAIGTALTHAPVVIIFDNQSTVTSQVSWDGVNVWKTFVAGEALVLDCTANAGSAPTRLIPIGTQFYVNGAGGATGNFKISILYAGN
jgi:hypothetical protein